MTGWLLCRLGIHAWSACIQTGVATWLACDRCGVRR